MNANEAHKRTSINQLLNPVGASSAHEHSSFSSQQLPSVGSPQPQRAQQDGSSFQPPYAPSSFSLRAASWNGEDQAAAKRRQESGAPSSRPYQYTPPSAADYADHASRAARPRGDEPAFGMDGTSWPPNEPTGLPYGTPLIGPIYSDERTALSGDFNASNTYNQPYPEQQQQPVTATKWQTTERVSLRLAARGSIPEHAAQQMRYGIPAQFFAFGIPYQPQMAPQPPKRPAVEEEEASAPKAKKAKSKAKASADSASGSSKRGYNAKKRSEAAQIAAQNAQLMPTVSYAQTPTEKGKEKAADAPMTIVSEGAQSADGSGPLHPELQFARCMSNRYRSEQFPRCVSCTRRWAGDTCRFQGIRFFLKNPQRNIVGISFVESQKADAPTMNFPTKWNVSLKPVHIRRIKRTIARALLPTLRQELDHLNMSEIIRRPRESEVRATCDTCMTSIFSSSWMCRLCGREACAECFEQVKELTENPPGATQGEIAALQARREKHAHSNPFFLSCTRRNEHLSKDFSPMSRFCKSELAQAIKEMEALLKTPDEDALPAVYGVIDPLLEAAPSATSQAQSGMPSNGSSTSSPTNVPDLTNSTTSTADGAGLATSAEPAAATATAATSSTGATAAKTSDIPFHPTKHFTDAELTEEVFRPIWAEGEPLVVTGLLSKFQIQWTPEYFIEKYETQPCLILECQTEVNKRVTVGEFFRMFGSYEGRKECWKLKDWPPSTDFKVAFPELYEDFSRAVPVPNYVRRDGALNIASHFPSNTVAPDLGPKMYNAMASHELAGSKGSTRLHMDMADAVNIMTYAAPDKNGVAGCAAWDLFRAEDSDKIRQFLKKRFKGSYQNDPIHSQQFYLDEELRKELWEEHGVKSHRVYQNPGEGVFIPAGCAHQVVNLADCVKVAADFVSPENIDRCEKLTREFREQNQSMVWKEDVLQLRTMMWFAWLSCCRQESG